MRQLDVLSSEANQLVSVVLDDGSIAALTFIYRPAIQRWSLDVSHPLLSVAGLIVCQHPNLLRAWRNLIPFGLAILSTNGVDPIAATDFDDGTVGAYILNASEVALVESDVLAPVPLVNP